MNSFVSTPGEYRMNHPPTLQLVQTRDVNAFLSKGTVFWPLHPHGRTWVNIVARRVHSGTVNEKPLPDLTKHSFRLHWALKSELWYGYMSSVHGGQGEMVKEREICRLTAFFLLVHKHSSVHLLRYEDYLDKQYLSDPYWHTHLTCRRRIILTSKFP